MNHFFTQEQADLQERYQTKKIAERIRDVRLRSEFNEDDIHIIEHTHFFFLATASANGEPDCSYKGGDPGFIRVIDQKTLAYPDYDGNGMHRSLGNIKANPHVGLLFIQFDGEQRRLRVNGSAEINENHPIIEQMPGAQRVILITAKYIFPNCPRYIPNMKIDQKSVYNPKENYEAPAPAWKSKPDLKDFL